MEGSPATIIMKQAGKLLARRAYSRGELREKLGGLAEAAALEPVLDLLEQQKLLNDNEYAYNFALYRIGNYGWGPARVYAALLRRLVPPPIIDAALERVRGELGRTAPLVDYIGKRCGKNGLPHTADAVNKLVAHLKRRGFDGNTIDSALKEILPAAVFRRIERGD